MASSDSMRAVSNLDSDILPSLSRNKTTALSLSPSAAQAAAMPNPLGFLHLPFGDLPDGAEVDRLPGQTHGEAEPPVKQIAACDLHEAMTYMRKLHADFDVLRVEFVDLIEMVSGSPLN